MFRWHACKLANLSACIVKCMTTINKIYLFLFIYFKIYLFRIYICILQFKAKGEGGGGGVGIMLRWTHKNHPCMVHKVQVLLSTSLNSTDTGPCLYIDIGHHHFSDCNFRFLHLET